MTESEEPRVKLQRSREEHCFFLKHAEEFMLNEAVKDYGNALKASTPTEKKRFLDDFWAKAYELKDFADFRRMLCEPYEEVEPPEETEGA